MSGYVLGRDAERDLDGLWEYIAQDSVEAADRLIMGILDTFDALARNPILAISGKRLTRFPVLFWPVGNYLLIYRATGGLVEIVAVVHGKRDIPIFLRRRGAA